MQSLDGNGDDTEKQRHKTLELLESAEQSNLQNEETQPNSHNKKPPITLKAFRRLRCRIQVSKANEGRVLQAESNFLQRRDRILKVPPSGQISLFRVSPVGVDCLADEGFGEGVTEKRDATPKSESGICVRLPFSDRQIPVYRKRPLSRLQTVALAGPRMRSVLAHLFQSAFSCCSTSLAACMSNERQIAHCYICVHLLEELASRVKQKTGLSFDPFMPKNEFDAAFLLPLPSEVSADHDTERSPGTTPSLWQSQSSKKQLFKHFTPLEAKAKLQQAPEVAALLDCYAKLLLAEKSTAVVLKRYTPDGSFAGTMSSPKSRVDKNSRLPLLLMTTPLLSCLPIPPWYLWQPADFGQPRQPRGFRVSVQLLHVALAKCHLFREEEVLAQKLLSAFEVYAYIARCANGEQLTGKLRSCFDLSKEVRRSCGLPQQLQPLLQAAEAAVSVYLQEQQPGVQQALLQRQLQHFPQLLGQVQDLGGWLLKLKREHFQVWKQWLTHMQQRRRLRLRRDQERQLFVAAGQAVERLWLLLQKQRDRQQFDSTGLQMQLLLLRRDEITDRHQLVEEVAAEVEELLTYAADTMSPQQLANFDIFAIVQAILSKLSRRALQRPGQPLRLLLLSTKEQPGVLKPASSCKKQQNHQGSQPEQSQEQQLPLQEQLRRFLCQRLFAVVNCRVNRRSVGGNEHLALHFPSFSTSTTHAIAPPVPPEDLPSQVQQQQHQNSDSVLASFQVTLKEPLFAISLHIGVAHPGLSKPIEAKADVPLPHQFEMLTQQTVCGGAFQEDSSSNFTSAPISVCLDIPFSSSASNSVQRAHTVHHSGTVPDSKAAIGHPSSLNVLRPEVLCAPIWDCGGTIDSITENEKAPYVLPLPSFLSPDETAARIRELQNYHVLDTPKWAALTASDVVLPDLRQAADAASRAGAERRSLSVTAAAVAAARAASAASLAEAAAAVSGAPTTAPGPASAALLKASKGGPSGRLLSAFCRVLHPTKRTPNSLKPEQVPHMAETSKNSSVAAGTDEGGAAADANHQEANEVPVGASPSFEAEPAHQSEKPEDVSSVGERIPVVSSSLERLSSQQFSEGSEAHKSWGAPTLASSPPLFPSESFWQVAGCIKLRVVIAPLPQDTEEQGGLNSDGVEWLAVRQARVESRTRQSSEGLFIRRRLATPEEALASCLPSPVLVQLQEEQACLAKVKGGNGPSLQELFLLTHASVQLYSKSQIEASFRLCLRLQQLFVESVFCPLPATDWEARLLSRLRRQPEDSFLSAKLKHFLTKNLRGFVGGFYERKLRQYLLTNEETAAAASTLLIPWAEDATTEIVDLSDAAEAQATGATGLQQTAPEPISAAAGTDWTAAATAGQQLQLLCQRPVIPYSAVVKEVDTFFPFGPFTSLCWSCNPIRRCRDIALVLLPLTLRQRIMRKEKQHQSHRRSYLWNGEGQHSSPKPPAAKSLPKPEIRAFVRGLYNVPRRRLPANPNEWHGRYRPGCQPDHRAPGFQDFAVYEARHPATTTSPENCSGSATAVDILQLSCPKVVVRVCLPDLGIDVSSATRPTEGENPSINQTLSLELPQLQSLEAERLYRQRGFISISVFDELQSPQTLASTYHDLWKPKHQAVVQKSPQVFLGHFNIQWRSLISSATENSAQAFGPTATAEALSLQNNQRHRQEHHQQLFDKLLDVGKDGTCCLCFLNGCFRLLQPKGLLSHARVTQRIVSEADFALLQQHMAGGIWVEPPLDMFVSLRLEIRGPAVAICSGLPRHFLPENFQRQQQQQQQDDQEQHHTQYPRMQPGPGSNEPQNLIWHDAQWRQRAQRCGVWTPPSSIVMDSFGSLRLLSRLLLPALPPTSVAVPFEPHCMERTAAFVSLLPVVDEHQLFKEDIPVWLTPQQVLEAGCCPLRNHALLLCCFFNGLDLRMQTRCSSFVAQGQVVGQGEMYFVLRLAPSGAAQLWDPSTGEALCILSSEQQRRQQQQQNQQQQQQQQHQQTDGEIWEEELQVLGALQGIDAEENRLQQRIALLLPVAERLAASQHRMLQEILPAQPQQDNELDLDRAHQREGHAALAELRQLEGSLLELQSNEEALIKEWHMLQATKSCPSPFMLGGPQQRSRQGLWPVARLSLLVSQQNAYINLQRMRCHNIRHSPLKVPKLVQLAEEDQKEFVPLTASAGVPESERHIRQSIRSRLQRRHRWRFLGLPALAENLRGAARCVVSATWWLNCYMKCIGILCCDRRLRPRKKVATLNSCRFALQNTKDWAPLFAEPIEFEKELRREATEVYERSVAALKSAESSSAANAHASHAAAAHTAQVLGVRGADAARVALLPPTGRVCPLIKKLHFSEPEPRAAVEAEKLLQRSIQQLLSDHYLAYSPSSASAVGSVALGKGHSSKKCQHVVFTAEPQVAVYELLGSYENARCTNSWDQPTQMANPALYVDGSGVAGNWTAPANEVCTTTTEQALQEALTRSVSACFPGRPIRGLIFHFVEMDALKLTAQLVDARVFDFKDAGLKFPENTPSLGDSQLSAHVTNSSVGGTCVGCLVVRLFSYPCGLYSGWIFAGSVN